MNRMVSSMPYYELTQFIKYMADWEAVPVLVLSEAYAAKLCHHCGCFGTARNPVMSNAAQSS